MAGTQDDIRCYHSDQIVLCRGQMRVDTAFPEVDCYSGAFLSSRRECGTVTLRQVTSVPMTQSGPWWNGL